MTHDTLYIMVSTYSPDGKKKNECRKTVLEEIYIVKKLKSPNSDENFPQVLKECKSVISEPLASIFRKSVYAEVIVKASKCSTHI